jgi:pimeloyl-ACP methyl ester carboxylesterase
MEKQIFLPTSNNKTILGKLRGPLRSPLVIFVHGLSSHLDHHIFFNGSRYFEKRGLSSFRFNLYGNSNHARKMIDCTLETCIYDLNRVVEHFRRRRIKQIFLVGHSLGGLTILLSKNLGYDSLVLWDPLSIQSPADLIVFVNSAAPATEAKQFLGMLKARHYHYLSADEREEPLFLSITSKGDTATGFAMPLGQAPSKLTKSMRKYDLSNPCEHPEYLQACLTSRLTTCIPRPIRLRYRAMRSSR